jgi:hypothetical protein
VRIFGVTSLLGVAFVVAAILATQPPVANARTSAWCQGSESVSTARHDVGVPIRVKARVLRAFWARSSSGRPTFLDLGYVYPNPRRLSVVIWGADRPNFPKAPERMFRAGTLICVQGVVSMYRGTMEIQVGIWDPEWRLLSV